MAELAQMQTPEDELEARVWTLMLETERDVLRAISAEMQRVLRVHLRHGRALDDLQWLCALRGSVDAAVLLLEHALKEAAR